MNNTGMAYLQACKQQVFWTPQVLIRTFNRGILNTVDGSIVPIIDRIENAFIEIQ